MRDRDNAGRRAGHDGPEPAGGDGPGLTGTQGHRCITEAQLGAAVIHRCPSGPAVRPRCGAARANCGTGLPESANPLSTAADKSDRISTG